MGKGHQNIGSFPITTLFPSIVTLIGLCVGMFAIKHAMAGKWEMAVIFVVIAGFIDGIDGRLARLLNATSSFGAHLDSLADFVNFGVAPAFIMYLWKTHEIKGWGWALTLFFIICQAIRLARFNAALGESNVRSILRDKFFQGVPAPMGAGLSLMPMMIFFFMSENPDYNYAIITPAFSVIFMTVIGVLMVSRIPTISIKKVKIRKEFAPSILAVSCLIFVSMVIKPWVTVPLLGGIYILSIPFSMFYFYNYQRKYNRITKKD